MMLSHTGRTSFYQLRILCHVRVVDARLCETCCFRKKCIFIIGVVVVRCDEATVCDCGCDIFSPPAADLATPRPPQLFNSLGPVVFGNIRHTGRRSTP